MGAMFRPARQSAAHALPNRGYHVAYRPGEVNHCPGCGRSHWLVGRALAECGFCATALPLAGGEFAAAGAFPAC